MSEDLDLSGAIFGDTVDVAAVTHLRFGMPKRPKPMRVIGPDGRGLWMKVGAPDVDYAKSEVRLTFVQCGAPWHPRKRHTRSMKGK